MPMHRITSSVGSTGTTPRRGDRSLPLCKGFARCGVSIPCCDGTFFLTGTEDRELGVEDVTWINASGAEMQEVDWADPAMRCFGMLIDGRARPTAVRQRGAEAAMLVLLNGHHDLVEFTLPEFEGGTQWLLQVDTNLVQEEAKYQGRASDKYGITGRSLILFLGATPQ
jgi:isoamylase